MRKDSTPRDMLLDRRVVERNIRKGIVSREEYEAFLRQLGDSSDNAAVVSAKLGEDDEPEDDDDAEEQGDDAEG